MSSVPFAGVDLSEIPLLSTRAELAELCRVNERTVDRWVADGLLRVTKLARGKQGRNVFQRAHVEHFLREAVR